MPENGRFLENKSLFLEEAHMVLCSASRVQRMLSIETSFEKKHQLSESNHQSHSNIRVLFAKCSKIEVSPRINHYSSKKHTCSCVEQVEFKKF